MSALQPCIMTMRCTKTQKRLTRSDLQTWVRKANARNINLQQLLPSTCRLDTADMHGMSASSTTIRACIDFVSPGRFFAAAVLKTMLAHIVTTYDIKLKDNMTRPQSLRIGATIVAHPTAKVMFRKRIRYGGAQ